MSAHCSGRISGEGGERGREGGKAGGRERGRGKGEGNREKEGWGGKEGGEKGQRGESQNGGKVSRQLTSFSTSALSIKPNESFKVFTIPCTDSTVAGCTSLTSLARRAPDLGSHDQQ